MPVIEIVGQGHHGPDLDVLVGQSVVATHEDRLLGRPLEIREPLPVLVEDGFGVGLDPVHCVFNSSMSPSRLFSITYPRLRRDRV